MSSSRFLLLALAALLLSPATAPGTVRHLDCDAGPGGDGSRAAPWNSLRRATRASLGPGDRLLLRRGTTCRGTLEPHGRGAHQRPALIGSYGRGKRPLISGSGPEALLLHDISNLVVQDLELTNRGDGSERKRGVHVVAEREVVRDVVLRRLYVHDVGGDLSKDANGSGGIQADVLGGAADPPIRFDGLRILGNRIEDVSRSGIFIVGTSDSTRPRASEPWPEASTGVLVRGNRLARLAGDGIVPLGTVGAIVERNIVSDGNRAGRGVLDPEGLLCNAGIWTFHANRTVIRRNEVFGMNFNNCDGTGFDIDYDQDRTIVQFNYSHDNEGGFMLLCSDVEPRTAFVRFNLSVDDDYTFQRSPCLIPAGFRGTLDGVNVYNNTFIAPHHAITTALGGELPDIGNPGSLLFANNIVVATTEQSTPLPCGDRCSHNLFFGLPPSGSDVVTADPLFINPARRGRGRLAVGRGFRVARRSPALITGLPIEGSARVDYFGNPVPKGRLAIGFHQPLAAAP